MAAGVDTDYWRHATLRAYELEVTHGPHRLRTRLGRDTRDVLNLIHECEQRQAFVTVLDPHVSTRGELGHIVLTVLGMVAQMERRFIKERQREGIQQAKAHGRYVGGKRRVDRAQVRVLHREGIGPSEIGQRLGCSRMQVYRILAEPE